MPAKTNTERQMAYFSPELWAKLRRRLFDEDKSFAEWARERAEEYVAPQKRKAS